MTAEVEFSSDTARAPAFTFPWRSISQGAPAWTDDAAIRVVVVTADNDFGGVQMHDIPAMDFHVTSIDSPDEVGTEVTQVCTHWAYRDELWPAALPNAGTTTPGPTIPTDEMAEAFISAANEFPVCGEDEPWISHAYRKCKAGLAAALAVQATRGQVSVAAQAAPAGVVMAQVFMAHKDAWRFAIEQMQAHVMKGDDTELRGWKNELAAFDRAYASLVEVGGHAKPVLVDDMKQELMALYNELMKQGRGMHYWNYAVAVLNRYASAVPGNSAAAPDMVSVKKEDANNYCRILAALGMEEEGDPVAVVQKLLTAAAAPVARSIPDEYYCALAYAEKALAAIANRQELVRYTIERVDTIGKASKRAKAALARLQTVVNYFDTVEKSVAAAPVAHPHHCTARSADGACEECDLYAQEMAEWKAEKNAAAQVVLPEPDFQLKWSASAGRYAFSKPITGDIDCYTADTVRALMSTAAGQTTQTVPAYWLDHATKTLIDPAEHAAEVEHAKSMRLTHLVNRRTPLFTARQEPTDTFEQRMSDWAQEDSIDAERWRECLKHIYTGTKGNGQPIFGLNLVPSESLYRSSLTSALQFTKDIDTAIAAQATNLGGAA